MRWATTFFLVVGIGLLLAWPLVVGLRPEPERDRAELARYGVRVLVYFGATTLAFLAAAICAILLARETRRRYADEFRKNLRDLVEGASRDHDRS